MKKKINFYFIFRMNESAGRIFEIGAVDAQNNSVSHVTKSKSHDRYHVTLESREELDNSQVNKVLLMISNCLAMNVENGVNMAGVIFLKVSYYTLFI